MIILLEKKLIENNQNGVNYSFKIFGSVLELMNKKENVNSIQKDNDINVFIKKDNLALYEGPLDYIKKVEDYFDKRDIKYIWEGEI